MKKTKILKYLKKKTKRLERGVVFPAAALVIVFSLTLFFNASIASAQADPPTIIHSSWNQSDAEGLMVISWRTYNSGSGDEVYYDTVSRDGNPSSYSYSATGSNHTWSGSGYIHDVTLTGLLSDTTYYFICGGSSGGYSAERSFRTAPTSSATFSFVAGGDSRTNPGIRETISQSMALHSPRFVFHTADYCETDDPGQYETWMSDVHNNWITPEGWIVPLVGSIGNHEGGGSCITGQYSWPGNERNYSINYGPDVHVIILCTQDSISGQTAWLQQDLIANESKTWKFAAFHEPPYSSGSHGSRTDIRSEWCPLFEQYGVDIVFCGHDHDYERSVPISGGAPVEDPALGTTYIVSGGWGAPLRSVGWSWWTAYAVSTYHYCVIDIVGKTSLTCGAYDINGNLMDQFTITKLYDNTPPGAPTGLTATASLARIDLDWNNNTENDLNHYHVYRSTTSGFTPGSDTFVADTTTSDYSDTGLSGSTTYYYVVTAVDTSGNESSPSNEASATTPVSGDGLSATYYNNQDFTGSTVSRIDPTINFNWGSGSPDPSIDPDTFSARWTGQIQAPYSETYTFYTNTDDGVRLWVNNVLIIDKWVDQAATEWSGTILLTADTKYDIKMEYYEAGGYAVAELRWSSPSIAKEIIPQAYLYSALPPDNTPPAAPTGLIATAISSSQIDLDWNNNTENDLDHYHVYRSTTSGFTPGSDTFVADTTTSDYSDTGLSASTTYYYKVTAVDTSNNESDPSAEASATTEAAPAQAPYGETPWAIPGKIEAEDYDTGGEGVAYHDSDAGNNGGAYRSEDVDIESCSDTGGGYNVGWIATGEWLEYTVDVTSSDTYNIELRVASPYSGRTFHLEFNSVDVTGPISVPNTGGWQNWTTVTVSGVDLSAGQQVMRIAMDTDLFNINYVNINVYQPPGTVMFQNFEPGNGTPGDYFWNVWQTNPSFETSIVQEGARSLKVIALDAWGGTVGINAATASGYFDMTNATNFHLWVYDTQGNNTVQLRLKDSDGDGGSGNDGNFLWSTMSSVQNQWTKITWDLSQYPNVPNLDWDRIAAIEIYESNQGTYYFDNACFEN